MLVIMGEATVRRAMRLVHWLEHGLQGLLKALLEGLVEGRHHTRLGLGQSQATGGLWV